MRSFNILFVALLLWSMMPISVNASSDQNVNVVLDSRMGGYFGKSSETVIQEPIEQVQSNGYYKIGGSLYAPGEEVIEKRTETSKTNFLGKVGNDSKFSLDASTGPIHYKDNYSDNNEQWKDIDLTPVNGVVTKAPYILVIDGAKVIVTDKKTGSVTSLELTDTGTKKLAKPSLSMIKGKAEKKEIDTDMDLEITWTNAQIRVTRILKSNKASSSAKFRLSQIGDGIKMGYKAEDSSVDKDKSYRVTASLINGILTETIDTTGVVYPVRIDPILEVNVSLSDTTLGTFSFGGNWNDDCWTPGSTGLAPVITNPLMNIESSSNWYEPSSVYIFAISRAYVFFNTIPLGSSATISSAFLSLNLHNKSEGYASNLTIQSGMPTYPHEPVVVGDYNKGYYSGDGGSLPSTSFSTDAWTNITLSSTGIGWINKTGRTKFCLRNSGDIAGYDPTGIGDAGLEIHAYDSGTIPYLHIEYTYPVSTLAASSITATGATLNGNITAGTATQRGFAWGTTSNSTTPASIQAPPASYTSSNVTTGSYSVGAFTDPRTGLIGGTTYYYRAAAAVNTAYLNTGGTITSNATHTFHTFNTSESFIAGATGNITVEAWGGGGGGGYLSGTGGGGGGGGAYARGNAVSVTSGAVYAVVVGTAGTRDNAVAATDSTFNNTTVVADAGTGSSSGTGAAGGTEDASTGDFEAAGGAGADAEGTHDSSGGGGGAGGPDGDGVSGTAGTHANGGGAGGRADNNLGGTAGAGGGTGINPAGDGGASATLGGGGGGGGGQIGTDGGTGGSGGIPGGGGGGTDQLSGGNGAIGQVTVTCLTSAFTSTQWGWGDEVSFATSLGAPTNVAATDGTSTSHINVTWDASSEATKYYVFRDAVSIDVGNVTRYDDSGAGAPSITAGTPSATDGTSSTQVILSLAGESANNGTSHTYKVVASTGSVNSTDSSTNTGYRGVGALTYQWMRSAAASDAAYSNIGGATADPYNDIGAPAPTITPGAATATDGTSSTVVTLSVGGESSTVGATRYFLCTLSATGATTTNTTGTDGYRGTTTLTYQWDRSAADSDADYSAIAGGTTDPYSDTGGVAEPDGRYYHAVVSMSGATSSNTTADRGYEGIPIALTTDAASSVEEVAATTGGTITNLYSGGDANTTGIQYGTASGSYPSDNHTHGTYGVGAFTINLSSLVQGTLYYFRAYATNTLGNGYGTEDTFLTKPEAPSSFSCTTVNSTAISYSWVRGNGSTNTVVIYKAGAYPANIADGDVSYNGTGTSNIQDNLTDATQYYFRGWSWTTNATLSQYSDGYDGCTSLTSDPPSITTAAATLVEENTTTVGGTITYSPATLTKWGVQYGTSVGYGTNSTTLSNPGVPYAFTKDLSSLTPGLMYYFRALAVNTVGEGYGSQLTFLTKPEAPTTLTATHINSTALTLNWVKGTGALNTYIMYNDGVYPANITDGTNCYNGTLTTTIVGGLTDAHTYYFKAWSLSINGTLEQYSDLYASAFGQVGDPPTVLTANATNVEELTATAVGNVTAGTGDIGNEGARYGTTTSMSSSVNTVVGLPAAAPHDFTANISGLGYGTWYYLQAYATNNFGSGNGSIQGFLTKPLQPTGLTVSVFNTTAVYINWTRGSGSSYTYIRHSNTTYPVSRAAGTLAANTTATYYILGGLTSGEICYVSAWALTFGNTTEQYSDSYTTSWLGVPSGIPTVTTNGTTGYGNNWATVTGQVHNTYPYPTVYGFDYGSNTSYGSTFNTTSVVGSGVFTATITGLNPSTIYHYRAWAENSYGVGGGSDMTFTTGGTEVLYESYQYGCNTTWSSVYESDAASLASNWTSGAPYSTSWMPVYGNNWTAQTFTTTQAHSVHQIVLWASRAATPSTTYIYVSIREAPNDNVTTPDLGIGLYNVAYVSIDGGPIEVSLENEIQLDANKRYAIVVRAPSVSPSTPDDISILVSNITGGSIYATGNCTRSINGGASWQSFTGYDVYFSIIGRPQPIYANVEAAQTFTVGAASHTVVKVKLILGRIGQPGNVYVSIRNYTGGVLSNTDLAVVALNGNAITLDKAAYDCILVPEKSLEAGKQYAIVVTAPSGDRYNYILMCSSGSDGYAGGTALISINAGLSWTAVVNDYNFEVWGNAVLGIINAKVFKNYLTTGDWLVVCEVLNVSPPYFDTNDDPSTLYIVSLMGLVGTTYGASPCELWEKSPVTIYLNPTQTQALTWGGNYKIRIGNIAGTIYSEYGLTAADWNASSLTYLDNWARLTAKDMEAYKLARTGVQTTYLAYVAGKGWVLNEDGGAIFNEACPRLSYVRPNLFQITSNRPEIKTGVAVTTEADKMNMDDRLGTYISGLIRTGSAAMGIQDPKTAGGIMVVGAYGIIAFGTVIKGFAWAGIIAAFPVILLGIYYGLLDVQLILVILAILILCFVREFWWKGG